MQSTISITRIIPNIIPINPKMDMPSNVCSTLTISRPAKIIGFYLKLFFFTKCYPGSVRTPKPSSVTSFYISILGLTM